MKLKFRNWLEAVEDIYGFEDKEPEDERVDDLPIKSFSIHRLLNELSDYTIGELVCYRNFVDQVQWGNEPGALRVRLTPNLGVILERMTSDLQGKPFWITKKLFKLRNQEFAGRESTVAAEINHHIQEISKESLDSPSANYNLYPLAIRLADRVKKHIHNMFIYEEFKKINENNYNILFSLVGAGVGRLLGSGNQTGWTPAGIIDISYNPERGSIKGILNTISVDNDTDSWRIDVPYFLSEFAPSQPAEEIITTIVSGLKFV